MAQCAKCGNEYDKAFQLIDHQGASRWFDSFECAIAMMAPRCSHCDCAIIGHGVEANGPIYCCAHCAGEMGASELRDRV